MADTWFILVMAPAVFVSMAFLAAVCLHCRKRGPLVSIRQTLSYEPSEFRVVRPAQTIIDRNTTHSPCTLLSPYVPSADPGLQRRQPSFTPTETESNPSYENPPDGPDSTNGESDLDDTGYLILLAGDQDPVTNPSRASTPSSDVRHEYENVPQKEDGEYQNVDPNDEESSQSDSSNYVNVLKGTHTDL